MGAAGWLPPTPRAGILRPRPGAKSSQARAGDSTATAQRSLANPGNLLCRFRYSLTLCVLRTLRTFVSNMQTKGGPFCVCGLGPRAQRGKTARG